MRIALLASAASSHTHKIANSLQTAGHRVFVYSLRGHSDARGALVAGITTRYFAVDGWPGYFANVLQLKRWLKLDRIDVLNAHYASGYGTSARLSSFHPFALSVWGSDVYSFPSTRVKKALLLNNLAHADMLLSTSQSMADYTRRLAPGREVVVTPFGVDLGMFSPGQRASQRTNSAVRVGIVKTLAPAYGVEYLIRAFGLIRKMRAHPPLELHVYGSGPLAGELRELAHRLDLGDVVRFYGAVPHEAVPAILRELDIFCVPSVRESFGVAAVEAMACGLPVVSSDASGLDEVMVDGLTGFVVPSMDPGSLARRLNELAIDPSLRQRMGASARTHIEKHYNWDQNFRTFEKALTSLAPAV